MAGLIALYGKEIIQQSNQIHAYSQVKYVSTAVIKSLQKSIKFIQAEKVRTEKKFMALVKKSLSRELKIIESIPGISENTAARLIASIAYFGLSPTKKESGSSLNRRRPISRMGRCKMWRFLYFYGISAAKYNADCKAMWTRMKAAGKPGKVIIHPSVLGLPSQR